MNGADQVQSKSKLSLIFTLHWKDGGVHHSHRLFSDKVSRWRDVFPGKMGELLLGHTVGDTVSVELRPEDFYQPWSKRLIHAVRPDQYQPDERMSTVTQDLKDPVPGRYYPQSFLRGVSNIYRVSAAPMRFLGMKGDKLLFDCNHPLAGRSLRVGAEIVSVDNKQLERGGRCEDWLEALCRDGVGMQQAPGQLAPGIDRGVFGPGWNERADTNPDAVFYEKPRMVQHLDATALRLLEDEYGKLIQPGDRVLDLMGSWDSHLPDTASPAQLTVLGMNEAELQANQRATQTVQQDLNVNATLPFEDGGFDVVICTASIEYLMKPQRILEEVARVLVPGGRLAISFTNRWFPPKAVAVWGELHEFERLGMVLEMVELVELLEQVEQVEHGKEGLCFTDLSSLSVHGFPRGENDWHPQLWFADPLYMVCGIRQG